MKNKKIMIYANLYFLFTIIYYFFGRYEWNIPSQVKLFLWLILIISCINFGYYFRYKIVLKSKKNTLNSISNNIEKKPPIKLFLISCISIIVFQLAWVFTVLGQFEIINIFNSLGSNYYERLAIDKNESSFIMQIRTLFWAVTLFAYPVGFTYYKNFNRKVRLLFIFTILIDILASLNMGITKNIGDIVLIYILTLIVNKKIHLSRNSKKKMMFIAIIFLVMFSVIQSLRDDSKGVSSDSQLFKGFSQLRETTIFDLIFLGNDSIVSGIDRIGVYVSHGYTGLAYSLELPFENTYGVGFSRAMIGYVEQYTNTNLYSKTYPARAEFTYGWPNGVYWSTAYTWFASAFSFYSLPLLAFLFGYFMSSIEVRFKEKKDIYSLTLLTQMFIMLIYLPANAQLFQARASLFGTFSLIVIYFITGRKYKNDQ